MKIETKFDVNNLTKHKFSSTSNNQFILCEVMEIESQTCYAGIQIFYKYRPIVCIKKFLKEWDKNSEYVWEIGHGISNEKLQIGWDKFREDELIEAPKELVDIVLSSNQASKS